MSLMRFYSLREAGEFYKQDPRTVKKHLLGKSFILDRSLHPPNTTFVACKHCASKVPSSSARSGFCKNCSAQKIGLKYLGIRNSVRMRGRNNPNYKDGSSHSGFRQQRLYRIWRAAVLGAFPICTVCGFALNRHTHHVLPYALFPGYKYETWNGVTLCGAHHKELHRLQLDLVLLPILYESLSDARQLPVRLFAQPEFQKLRSMSGGSCLPHEILPLVPKNYHKRILALHPEFARLVLGLKA